MKLSIEAVNKCCSDHELIWFWHLSGTSHQTLELPTEGTDRTVSGMNAL